MNQTNQAQGMLPAGYLETTGKSADLSESVVPVHKVGITLLAY